ncbi:MAG: glycosyltransferase family 4 protein [Myxococcales bacterium]
MRSSPLRVAQVATTAGSVKFLLVDHIVRLQAEGYEVEAVCASDDSVPAIEKLGIPVQRIPFVREPSPLPDLHAVRALRRLFVARNYQVVHSHTPKAGLLAPLAARLARVPVVLHTIHGLLFHDRSVLKDRLLGGACELWTAKLAHRLLSQSREDIDVVQRFHMKRPELVDYIGNGIDITRFHPDVMRSARARMRAELGIGPDDVVVGMVGRLVREKGFVEFFTAMREVMAQRPGVRTLIVGPVDQGQSDSVHQADFATKLDPARTIWLGRRDDLPELYSAMDIFALPSYREGIPRTLMEASAMGLPVVATRIRGCREVAKDGVTGLLVEPRQVPPLVQAILRLVDDPKLRDRFGRAGRAHVVSQFDASIVLDRLVAYYKRTVGTPR